MPEYILGRDHIARVTPETWLGRYWLAVRTLRGDDTELSRAEAEDYLRDQALGNPSAALRRRCWLAMEQHGVRSVPDDVAAARDEHKGA
jgi:hypothetical protein